MLFRSRSKDPHHREWRYRDSDRTLERLQLDYPDSEWERVYTQDEMDAATAKLRERLEDSEIDRICWTGRAENAEIDQQRYLVLRDADLDSVHKGGLFAGKTPENIVINGDDLDRHCDQILLRRRYSRIVATRVHT